MVSKAAGPWAGRSAAVRLYLRSPASGGSCLSRRRVRAAEAVGIGAAPHSRSLNHALPTVESFRAAVLGTFP
jgi:hypothetical protein